MDRTALREIILSQQKIRSTPHLVVRDIFPKLESYLNNPFVIIISGIRRAGKSTLLSQLREKYPGYYLSFDDDRLVNFKIEDFQALYELFLELFGKKELFYFDEIQNIKGWERFVRRLHDEKKKVFATGSNASMLSRELGTHLTGRYLEINLYPFSFREFLRFKGITFTKEDFYLAETKIKLKKSFEEYLTEGGLPEYLTTQNKEYLKTLSDNVIYRDVMVRYGLTNEKTVKELVGLAATNISSEISFNSVKKMLLIGSPTTVKEYFNYLENSFMIFLIAPFDYSLKKQIYSRKKAYLIDTGLAVSLGFRTSKNFGPLLENLVFVELKRRQKEVFFYTGKQECDFIIRNGFKVTEAVQVCYELTENNRNREINGLLEAMDAFKLKEGLILTFEQEEEIIKNGKKIQIIPVFKWLLETK